MDVIEKKIRLNHDADPQTLFGYNDSHLSAVEKRFDSSISVRGEVITIRGDVQEVKIIEKIFEELQYIIKNKGSLNHDIVESIISLAVNSSESMQRESASPIASEIIYTGKKWNIVAKTSNQQIYWDKAKKNDIVFAIGPAGTGKTFLAVAMALAALKNNEVSKIVITRPAVEAGESLGFLPGDLNEKVVHYLRPILDALSDMLLPDKLKHMMDKGILEIVPLAYMRGRTLSDSFIVLDEAQNTTTMQMKMFLTRLGRNSKAIVTGDITQTDLPHKSMSGLIQIQYILKNIDGIEFVYFDKSDVVRHRLVAQIIEAYDRAEEKHKVGTHINGDMSTTANSEANKTANTQ